MASLQTTSFKSIELNDIDLKELEFEKVIEERLKCPICRTVLFRPMQLPCGHHVCVQCIDKVFEHGEIATCPQNIDDDCKEINKSEVFPDISVKREVLNLKVKCLYHTYGCETIIKLGKLKDHTKNCQYEPIECENEGCTKLVAKCDYQNHQKVCPYLPVRCDLCNELIAQVYLKSHKEKECAEELVSCPYGCGLPFKRKYFESHKLRCSKRPEECSYKYFGCSTVGSKPEIELHQKNATDEHLQLIAIHISEKDKRQGMSVNLNASDDTKGKIDANEKEIKNIMSHLANITEQLLILEKKVEDLPTKSLLEQHSRDIEDLKAKLLYLNRYSSSVGNEDAVSNQLASHDRQLGSHDVRIAEIDLRCQIIETASYNGVIIWKIREYWRRKQDAASGRTLSLYSQPFYTSKYGYKMCVRVYLNGDGVGKGTHLSLFFVVMGGEFDALLPWPFQQRVTLYILDQGRTGRHLSDNFHPDATSSSFKRPTSEMNIASGCPLFVNQSVLENSNNSYIKDDVLFIRCNVDTTGLANF